MADYDWLAWAKQLQAIAQNGLAFTHDPFDEDRYRQLADLAADVMAHHSQAETAVIRDLFQQQTGYATPKVGVRAAIFRENGRGPEILMVKESFGEALWTTPGGFADVGDTPSQAVIREVGEETGLTVRPVKLTAVYDIDRQGQGKRPFSLYRIFFLCQITGGQLNADNFEIDDVGFFPQDQLPPLDWQKTTAVQIQRQFDHYRQSSLPTDFD